MRPEPAAGDPAAAALRALHDAMEGAASVALAVSGGGDSMALLHLARQVADRTGQRLIVATVDHGLRPGSAAEAAEVARHCAQLGLTHQILHWQDRPAGGNLQAAARAARYRLLADWARGQGADVVLLGHTQDDEAETFLMRLGREAGLDGLSGMAGRFRRDEMDWARPLLGVSRADLRAVLVAAGVAWAEDPSNDDPRFARVRARQALAALAPLGIEAEGLARVAAQLAEARQALQQAVADLARACVTQDAGDLLLAWDRLATAPAEMRRRLIVAGLGWITGAPYPPRRAAVARLLAGLERDGQRTLEGCVIWRRGGMVRMGREARALGALVGPTGALWDGRWQIDGPHAPGLHVAMLGPAGLALCPDWRASGLPRATLLASPAIWRGAALVAAPLAAPCGTWTARIVADFHDGLVSH